MLTVHHLGVSQSERIVWLCEELDIPYELKLYARDPTTRLAPAEYKTLHPIGTAPIITDGAVTLAESGAIVEYIIGRHGQGRLTVAPDRPDYADYLFWFHFVNGSLLPTQMFGLVLANSGLPADSPLAVAMATRRENAFALIERRLGEAPYLAGAALTAADIMAVFALTTMRLFAARDLAAAPNTRAYLARIGARPAYQRAMAKGDPGLPAMLA